MTQLGDEPALLLDASVLVELVIEGDHAVAADRLLDHMSARPEVELTTAGHGLIEAISALRRMNLAGLIDDAAALVAARWLRGLDLRLDPTAPRIEQLWDLRHSMTAYDAAYAAAARGLGMTLISVDRRLVTACAVARVAAVHLEDLKLGGAG